MAALYFLSWAVVLWVVTIVFAIGWCIYSLLRVSRRVATRLFVEPTNWFVLSQLFGAKDLYRIEKATRYLPNEEIAWELIDIAINLKILCGEGGRFKFISCREDFEFQLKFRVDGSPLARLVVSTRRGIRKRCIERITVFAPPT